mmetsp:Transcript_8676/g.9942  ORF Transcript_8676/g.9942 Transcript_8676/m.9942 type:complete len:214 (-) Transcript_8676:1289-1930(-)
MVQTSSSSSSSYSFPWLSNYNGYMLFTQARFNLTDSHLQVYRFSDSILRSFQSFEHGSNIIIIIIIHINNNNTITQAFEMRSTRGGNKNVRAKRTPAIRIIANTTNNSSNSSTRRLPAVRISGARRSPRSIHATRITSTAATATATATTTTTVTATATATRSSLSSTLLINLSEERPPPPSADLVALVALLPRNDGQCHRRGCISRSFSLDTD